MKKLLFVAGIALFSLSANAQGQGDISLNLYGGYTFQDKIHADNAEVTVEDGFQYGAGLEFFLRNTKSLELKYLRMDNQSFVEGYSVLNGGFQSRKVNTAINYVLFGGNNYFPTGNPKVMPFIGLDLGVGWVSGDVSTDARFAWDLKAGVKIKASDAVSVKLQAYFQTIWATYGSDTYWYPYWGYVTYASDASLYQFGLGAAISFDFKN